MSNKKTTKHKGSSSILADHQRIGTRFVPPMAQLNMKTTRWVDGTMPELLWQGLLVDRYGLREGMGLALSLARAANELFPAETKRPFLALASGYGEMTQQQQEETIARLAVSEQLTLLQQGLMPLLELYPKCPLTFLLNGEDPETKHDDGLEQIKAAVVRLYDKRSQPATLVIANAIYIGALTGKINYTAQSQVPNLEAVLDYPNTEESRMVASSLRASITAFTSMGDEAVSEWPRYFWNRGLELEPCDVDGVYDSL
jgi:hypothetical protein